MLTRRTPMKRSPWPARPLPERRPVVLTPATRRGVYTQAEHMDRRPKEEVTQHEGYRRLVAALPCIYCGVENHSNHAHRNSGKGRGIKTDARQGFPLCVDRPGVEGCHTQHDQRRLMPGLSREAYAAVEDEWGRRTRLQIINAGLWPAGLETIE